MGEVKFKSLIQQILLMILAFLFERYVGSLKYNFTVSDAVGNYSGVNWHIFSIIIMGVFMMSIAALQYGRVSASGKSDNFSFTWILICCGIISISNMALHWVTGNYEKTCVSIVILGLLLIVTLQQVFSSKNYTTHLDQINYFFIFMILFTFLVKELNFEKYINIKEIGFWSYIIVKYIKIIIITLFCLYFGYFIKNGKKIGEDDYPYFRMTFLICIFYFFTKYLLGIYDEGTISNYGFSDFFIIGMTSLLYIFHKYQNHKNYYYTYYEFFVTSLFLPFIINTVITVFGKMAYLDNLLRANQYYMYAQNYILNEQFVFVIFGIYIVINLIRILIQISKQKTIIKQENNIILFSILMIMGFNTGILWGKTYYIYKFSTYKINTFLIFLAIWGLITLYSIFTKKISFERSSSKYNILTPLILYCGLFVVIIFSVSNFGYSVLYMENTTMLQKYKMFIPKSNSKFLEYSLKVNNSELITMFMRSRESLSARALYYAIENKNMPVTLQILKYMDKDKILQEIEGKSLLKKAIEAGDEYAIRLVEKGAEITEDDIVEATINNREKLVIYLIENTDNKIDYNYELVAKGEKFIDNENISMLGAAALNANERLLKYFQNKGARYKVFGDKNDIFSYAIRSDDLKFAKNILAQYPVNKKENLALGKVLLIKNDLQGEKIKFLLKNKIGINETNYISLMDSNYKNKEEILKCFLKEGISVNTKDEYGRTGLEVLLNNKSYDIKFWLAMIKSGAVLKSGDFDRNNENIIRFAFENNQYRLVKYLLEKNQKISENLNLISELASCSEINDEYRDLFGYITKNNLTLKKTISDTDIIRMMEYNNYELMQYLLESEKIGNSEKIILKAKLQFKNWDNGV